VDYEELVNTKRDVILATPPLRELIEPVEVSDFARVICSKRYCGIGCDLRDLPKLDHAMKLLGDLEDSLVLCVAEVSVTYMDPDAADALIAWARTLSDGKSVCFHDFDKPTNPEPGVTFALLEQYLPDGPEHPFAKTMLRHFHKLHTPLRSIHKYPSLQSQMHRFSDAGWEGVNIANLWELWSDPRFLAPSQRLWLDGVEPFDEWEEFALFAGHYFLLTAPTTSNSFNGLFDNGECADFNGKRRPDLTVDMPSLAYDLRYIENPNGRGLRRHAAMMEIRDRNDKMLNAVACHGGASSEGRSTTSDIYTTSNSEVDLAALPSSGIPARLCHTITKLRKDNAVLIGGRTSPGAAMKDCYLQTRSAWERIHDLPFPRFRHCTAAIMLPNSEPGVLVFGGKSAADHIQDEPILWDAQDGWRTLQVFKGTLQPRFGAVLTSLGNDYGILTGGMRADGVVLDDLWTWKLVFRDEQAVGINFVPCTLKIDDEARRHFGRFGASHSFAQGKILLFGGVGLAECVPERYEILALDIKAFPDFDTNDPTTTYVSTICLQRSSEIPRPMLVGHSTNNTAEGEIVIAGGGAVCFSFGTYWNSGFYTLHEGGVKGRDWKLADSNLKTGFAKNEARAANDIPIDISQLKPVERIRVGSEAEFLDILQQSKPRIFESLDIGSCTSKWTKEYLLEQIGPGRQVTVHEARGRSMNFQRKDFKYLTKSFGDFLNEIHSGAHLYLRSISSTEPTKRVAHIELDFPEISDDFRLPPELQFVIDNFHSSPLRITGDVAMWLHVDTMANVLCQVQGSKRLILYPPADMVKLDFPPGSTTSNSEIFRGGSPHDIFSISDTHPTEAVLKSGDVLFIPPLWAHTAAPLTEVSVAVNVFFRSLSKGYAAGKDVYGNRDFEAYEHGRRGVENIARAFDGLPSDLAHAYLLRLAGELKTKAERRAPT
jgi:tRNA wybutosine-synthesizing protein 4